MAKGMLYHIVLHKLAEKPSTGYALCGEIEQACGQRPSYGSIYPLLERLVSEGLVRSKKDGKRKIHELTAKGKRKERDLRKERGKLLDDLSVQLSSFLELIGQDPEPMMSMLARLKRGDAPLGPVTANMVRLRDLVFRMAQDGRIERHEKQVKAILQNATERLEAL